MSSHFLTLYLASGWQLIRIVFWSQWQSLFLRDLFLLACTDRTFLYLWSHTIWRPSLHVGLFRWSHSLLIRVILSMKTLWRVMIWLQLMEYNHLLDMADQCEDPHMKLVYACKCLFLMCSRTASLRMTLLIGRMTTELLPVALDLEDRELEDFTPSVFCSFTTVQFTIFLRSAIGLCATTVDCTKTLLFLVTQQHGHCLFTMRINGRGNLLILFLERPMKWWMTMVSCS